MKKILRNVSIILIVSFAIISCATSLTVMRFQDRTLLFDPNSPSLIYPYTGEKCKHPERRIFRGCKKVRVVKRYDLRDSKTRARLINSAFTCTSKLKYRY